MASSPAGARLRQARIGSRLQRCLGSPLLGRQLVVKGSCVKTARQGLHLQQPLHQVRPACCQVPVISPAGGVAAPVRPGHCQAVLPPSAAASVWSKGRAQARASRNAWPSSAGGVLIACTGSALRPRPPLTQSKRAGRLQAGVQGDTQASSSLGGGSHLAPPGLVQVAAQHDELDIGDQAHCAAQAAVAPGAAHTVHVGGRVPGQVHVDHQVDVLCSRHEGAWRCPSQSAGRADLWCTAVTQVGVQVKAAAAAGPAHDGWQLGQQRIEVCIAAQAVGCL